MIPEQDTVPAQPWRTGIMVLVFMGICGLIVARLYTLQVVQSESLSERALRQRMRNFVLPAQRGGIYDKRSALGAITGGLGCFCGCFIYE